MRPSTVAASVPSAFLADAVSPAEDRRSDAEHNRDGDFSKRQTSVSEPATSEATKLSSNRFLRRRRGSWPV